MRKILLLFLFSFGMIVTTEAQSNEVYLVNVSSLNMRSGPGAEFKVVKMLLKNEKVILIEKKDNGWWHVISNSIDGYVNSSYLKIDDEKDWEKTNSYTGGTPECSNVTPKYDYEMDNFLKINVGSNTDVIVKLMDKSTDDCIRIVYVRSGESFSIKNIPEGKYYLKIAYGKDYRKKINNSQCYVKFMKNAEYEIGKETLDFALIKKSNTRRGRDEYENWEVPSYELSLDVIVSKNRKNTFNSQKISEESFNQ